MADITPGQGLNLRLDKTRALHWDEGDGNLTYLYGLITSSQFQVDALNIFSGSAIQDSASFDDRINNIPTVDVSVLVTTSSFNELTSSIKIDSASFDERIKNVTFDTSSLVKLNLFNSFTQSVKVYTSSLNNWTSSVNRDSASFDARIRAISGSGSGSISYIFNAPLKEAGGVVDLDLSMYVTTSSFNDLTSSINSFTSSVKIDSASFNSRINNISSSIPDVSGFLITSSFNSFTQSINTFTASLLKDIEVDLTNPSTQISIPANSLITYVVISGSNNISEFGLGLSNSTDELISFQPVDSGYNTFMIGSYFDKLGNVWANGVDCLSKIIIKIS